MEKQLLDIALRESDDGRARSRQAAGFPTRGTRSRTRTTSRSSAASPRRRPLTGQLVAGSRGRRRRGAVDAVRARLAALRKTWFDKRCARRSKTRRSRPSSIAKFKATARRRRDALPGAEREAGSDQPPRAREPRVHRRSPVGRARQARRAGALLRRSLDHLRALSGVPEVGRPRRDRARSAPLPADPRA